MQIVYKEEIYKIINQLQLLESDGQAIGPVGELRTLSKNQTRAVHKPNPFALLA